MRTRFATTCVRTYVVEHLRLIPLTCNEIRHLFIALVIRPVLDPAHLLGWSLWRCRHQAQSGASHYRRQAAQD
ncbi:hypothetical protein OHT59_46595 [Streptomyces sp. NBC_00243]|uniref:hypothetical protein n=1 Tax=Streptomyces sp. NBC_00243 TaxID=2975688 RepID=UPI002DDA4D92|nr:hypothetical protein [Streptomyces sp. NBC_00243]WRZ26242.1 hypothetical protein OHT59_46595 [Streptomyces sp. NBC_00243]